MQCKGASIVPFFQRNGEVYLVLGRERNDRAWSSNRWSGFGGSAYSHETPQRTAAREFLEESMHMPCFDGEVDDLEAALNRDDYALKVVSHAPTCYYVTYVKEFPAVRWEECLRHLQALRRRAADIETCKQTLAMRTRELQGHPRSLRATVVADGDGIHVQLMTRVLQLPDTPQGHAYARWAEAQRARDATLADLQATHSYLTAQGDLADVALEKDLIDCWSVAELQTVVRTGARRTLRKCFVPTLYAILHEFE